nr:NS2 [Mute swan feces associated ambidensovirus 2]
MTDLLTETIDNGSQETLMTTGTTFGEILDLIEDALQRKDLVKNPLFWKKIANLIPISQMEEEAVEDMTTLTKEFNNLRNPLHHQREKYLPLSWQDCQEYLKKLLVLTFQMSFKPIVKKPLTILAKTCENMLEDLIEDSSSYLNTTATFTSSTTAPTQMEAAGASGGKKRKATQQLTFEDLFLDENGESLSEDLRLPTGKIYSYISQRKDGKLSQQIYSDRWKKYKMTLKLWQSEDLVDVPKKEHWKHAMKEIQVTFDEASPFLKKFKGMEEQMVRFIIERRQEDRSSIMTSFPKSWNSY